MDMIWNVRAGRRWVIVSSAAIVVLGLFGAILAARYDVYDDQGWTTDGTAWHEVVRRFHPDAEKSVPAAFTAGIMIATAYWAWRWATRVAARSGLVFAALFTYLGVDDWRELHEWLEWKTGVDWQVLYLPLVAVGGIAFLMMLRRLAECPRFIRGLWIAGAAVIAGALALEQVQWDSADVRVSGYSALMVVEEVLEMIGPALMGLALIVATALSGIIDPGTTRLHLGETALVPCDDDQCRAEHVLVRTAAEQRAHDEELVRLAAEYPSDRPDEVLGALERLGIVEASVDRTD
jgi:hypothetical protein